MIFMVGPLSRQSSDRLVGLVYANELACLYMANGTSYGVFQVHSNEGKPLKGQLASVFSETSHVWIEYTPLIMA